MHRTPFSRRTWLWTSTTALAAACARPSPTRVPASGPEGARALSQRGFANLLALTELGAALRWMHPSDQVVETEWEPLLLDGIRSLEAASTRVELVEGLRGLFGSIAPTMQVWRSDDFEQHDDARDEPACPDPAAEPEEQDDATPTESTQRKAKPAATTSADDQATDTPSDDADAKPEDDKPDDDKPDDDKSEDAKPDDDKPDDDKPDDDKPTGESDPEPEAESKPEPATKPDPEPDPDPDPDPTEDRPALHAALFGEGDALELIQWHRRGFADGLDPRSGCATRVARAADSPTCAPPSKPRRKHQSACSSCAADGFEAHAPAVPATLTLPRGLACSIPLALWRRDGRTLPPAPALAPAPAFDEHRAWDYDLRDRGTRLLAVLRCHALLRRFYAHADRVTAPDELLRAALCAAADSDDPAALHGAIEQLIAGFGDGNGELLVELGKPARRFVPALSLAWIDERVVVVRTPASSPTQSSGPARAGDVVTAIDGVAIDELLATTLPRCAAATASAAIVRAVSRLLSRRERGTAIELSLLRDGEQPLDVQLPADTPLSKQPLADLRPRQHATELADGVWYVDATRTSLVRRLRRARAVIVDLRGHLADDNVDLEHSWLAHALDEPLTLARTRVLAGPDAHAKLRLIDAEPRLLEPRRPRVHARLIALADARTRGAAELLLAGFDHRGLTIVGSNSAGDAGQISHAWLPGGWQLRFTTNELRQSDGTQLWARGVPASVFVEPTRASVAAGEDAVLNAALALV